MIVVDTSVWIDVFAGRTDLAHVELFLGLVDSDHPIGLTDVVLTEVLQGIRHRRDLQRVDDELSAHEILCLEGLDDFRRAADLYRRCRAEGVTIRRTTDCLIAAVCVREHAALLHADADFDRLAAHTSLEVVPLS